MCEISMPLGMEKKYLKLSQMPVVGLPELNHCLKTECIKN